MASQQLTFTVRHPDGQGRVSVASNATVGELKNSIVIATSIPRDCQQLRTGYPPTVLEAADDALLLENGLKGGAIIVSILEPPAALPTMLRRIVPANNSCLFSCFTYTLMNKSRSLEDARKIRRIVADKIKSSPQVYSEVYLNKDPAIYCSWIMDDNAWGGAIEIAMLAEHFKVQVCCWDVQSTRFDLYECPGAMQRVYFIYDGLHYDPLAIGNVEDESDDVTKFECENESPAFVGSKGICEHMNAQRQFTDTSKFALRCLVCGAGLTGEDDAMKHAQSTKPPHTNFSEYQA